MLKKIISGGQTGADCAALDFAILHEIPHGGWCPKGRLCEKGTIDQRYQLKETSTKNYPQRTEKNVRDSDGIVIFTISPNITGGSKKTAELAAKHHIPWIHLHRGGYEEPERLLRLGFVPNCGLVRSTSKRVRNSSRGVSHDFTR